MKMTDSSKGSDNGNGSNNGNKRPGAANGAGGPLSKIVKFNGYAARGVGNGVGGNKKTPHSQSSPEELLAQRQALPIYPTRQR